jgi:hypothetical protein
MVFLLGILQNGILQIGILQIGILQNGILIWNLFTRFFTLEF